MSRSGAAPDRRHAFLVRTRPLPTFRVRSASGDPSHLVVLNVDGGLACNCVAAGFRATCSHVRIARRSIERRTGWSWDGALWHAPAAGTTYRPMLSMLQGGRRDEIDAAWEAAS